MEKTKRSHSFTAIFLLGVILLLVPFSSAFCFWWWCPDGELAVIEPSNAEVLQYSFHFWQMQKHYLNQTSNPNQILNRIVATYDKSELDYITGDNPLQFYIYYNAMIKSWNENNPSYYVNECNLTARAWHISEENPYYTLTKSWDSTQDYANAKEFFFLENGDTIYIDMVCYFENATPSNYKMPTSMQLITPTWKCKACQYYDWAIVEKTIMKAEDVSSKTTSVVTFIKKVVFLNFEMWIILFWIFMILLLIMAISFIFMGIYWVFLYIKRRLT